MWRVSNPIQFNTTTTAGKNPVDEKLLKLFSESLAAWVAGQSAATILHLQNDSADQRWLADLNQRLEPLGVQAASVGLRQVGLSEAATEKIYERMSAVRTRTSRQLIDGMVNDERQLTALQSRQQAQVLDDAYRAAQQTRKSAESQLLTAYARQYGGSNSFAAALNDSPRATGKSDQ
jgi:regulator of protease activity HflC (stomatin/prohibitin superfamily)